MTAPHRSPTAAGELVLPGLRRLLRLAPSSPPGGVPAPVHDGTRQPEPGRDDEPGHAILIEFYAGDHEYWSWRTDERKVHRLRRRYLSYYRGYGIASMAVVPISCEQVRQHSEYSRCRAGNCPGLSETRP